MTIVELIRVAKLYQGPDCRDPHAKHFDAQGRIIFRRRRDISKLRMAEGHVTLRKIHQHGVVKHHGVA